jgi:hypothetical protein
MEVHTEQQLDKMPAAKFKTLENKVRRMLARRGYKLIKSRARDPAAIGYGDYVIR